MATHGPFCSVIVVNFNGKHLLAECLSSVLAQDYPGFEVVLVDNGSADGSVDYVRATFPAVHVVAAHENLGYAAGNNLGVRSAKGEVIILLNNDTKVRDGWLEALVDAVSAPDTAIASSLVFTRGIPREYYEKNGSINFLGHNIMRRFERPENIFYGGGASLAFKPSLLGEPFDPDYFAYGEDVYLGLRARFRGYRVVHTNDSVVDHLGGATTKRMRSRRLAMLQERNRLLNMLLFFSPSTLLRMLPFIVLGCLAKLAVAAVSHRYSAVATLQAWVWLSRHGAAISAKRKALRREFAVPEAEVVAWMTAHVTNGESIPGRVLNALATAYCKALGVRTLESLPRGTR